MDASVAALQVSVFNLLKSAWIIPAGMVALYYYGWYHFNTPDYSFDRTDQGEAPTSEFGRLLTLAPPIFTTTRSRFNRFALRYILLLEVSFLAISLFPNFVNDVADVSHVAENLVKNSDSVQHRAIVALFALTGLLSSFPIFKDFDGWILGKLHKAALIPDDVRLMASTLFEAPFVPSEATVQDVRGTLSRRDTIRVADGKAKGTLERSLLRGLWLKTQLCRETKKKEYFRCKIKLERDLRDIEGVANDLRGGFIAFFKDQEKLVPADINDIDDYISDHEDNPEIKDLGVRRRELQANCDSFYLRLCLLAALATYATQFSPEGVNDGLKSFGFQVEVMATPAWDWDSVIKVVGGVLLAALVCNVVFALLVDHFHYNTNPLLALSRSRIITFAMVGTLSYAAVVLIAIRFKRHWARESDEGETQHRPENVLLALYGYIATCFLFFSFQYLSRGYVTWAPFLYALNQAVATYFIGIYIDRTMKKLPKSLMAAGWHAIAQSAAALIAVLGTLPDLPTDQSLFVGAFSVSQAAIIGFVIGLIFQHTYCRAGAMRQGSDATLRVVGDLQTRLASL